MAIELRITVEIVDTEVDNPAHSGIVMRHGRVTPLVSEVPDMSGIFPIAKAVTEREMSEVQAAVMDTFATMERQP